MSHSDVVLINIHSLESHRYTLDIRKCNHPFTDGVLVSFLGSFCSGKIFLGSLVLDFRNGPIGVVAFSHPKDKNQVSETAGCVYEISCKNCDFTYVGETGRLLGTRLKEHCKEAEKISTKVQTRASRLTSVSEPHKSAISDHIASTNHIIDWEGAQNPALRR